MKATLNGKLHSTRPGDIFKALLKQDFGKFSMVYNSTIPDVIAYVSIEEDKKVLDTVDDDNKIWTFKLLMYNLRLVHAFSVFPSYLCFVC